MEDKAFFTFIILICICKTCFGQNNIYQDYDGTVISKNEYYNKFKKFPNITNSWVYKYNQTKIRKLKNDKLQYGTFNYSGVKIFLENLTSKLIKIGSNILISYHYKNDLCNEKRVNFWNKTAISSHKSYLNPQKKALRKKNIFLIVLFEEGITLKNKPRSKHEYFYTDKNNFFKKLLFKSPSTCGSHAILKPNGQTVIHNGEYRADMVADYLVEENWKIFFPKN